MSRFVNQLTPDELRHAVANQYGRVASYPDAIHPFPVGRDFAISLGYDFETLDKLPKQAVNSFAGISNPISYADLQPGEIVVDLGCGAGMDTIIISRQVGPGGFVHSVDLSEEMLACARVCAAEAGRDNIRFYPVPAEAVPLADSSVDAIIVNGIFNLCPDKGVVMAEAYRLLRPGGRMLVSEIVVQGAEDIGENDGTCRTTGKDLSGVPLESWFR